MQLQKISKLILILFLTLLIAIAALPGYLKLKWNWMELPKISNFKQIKNLGKTGLTFKEWQKIEENTLEISSNKWLRQKFQKQDRELTLLLLVQKDNSKQPEVEWMDVIGSQKWQTDSYQNLNFTIEKSAVQSRFFRAWSLQETFAVVQWYAWKNSGSPTPAHWFFADQIVQWQKQRLPWVAVSLQVKIEPLGDIETVRSLIESLAQEVQSQINQVL